MLTIRDILNHPSIRQRRPSPEEAPPISGAALALRTYGRFQELGDQLHGKVGPRAWPYVPH